MKKLLLVLLALPTLASAEFNAMAQKPNILELRKYMPVSGKMEMRFVHDSPRVVIKLAPGSKEVKELFDKVLESDLSRLNCDGDYFLTYDGFGTQYINIQSIKTCLDDEGSVVVHSVGIAQLNDKQIADSKRVIDENLKPVAITNPAVNNSTLPKPDTSKSGVFSPKLGKAVAK
ncbi:hypothetical protein SHI21_19340 [Bacteriovorax sp. PP10]|uniref:Uncharacterized protein n=1 Tax=Bacteriovorax antarcticus TaxID=3088717 RepID=A0ABU5VZC0_9BACT|nr:hypothetical protein [Bacteriovorax sp. PP10]MEA9358399.1 hypothetical protein [Bacteriovorax sp. PP10]